MSGMVIIWKRSLTYTEDLKEELIISITSPELGFDFT